MTAFSLTQARQLIIIFAQNGERLLVRVEQSAADTPGAYDRMRMSRHIPQFSIILRTKRVFDCQ